MSKLGQHFSFKLAITSKNCQARGEENGGRSRKRFYNYNLGYKHPSSSRISQSSYDRGKCKRFSHYLPIILLFLLIYLNVRIFTCAISVNSYEGMLDPFPRMKSLDPIRINHQCVLLDRKKEMRRRIARQQKLDGEERKNSRQLNINSFV
ncbi:transmembrane protein, putative [Medicago truncatula]|uniref:Transmembrane protein, putative n=1 Tax=Medicago truncatula TaxID=3880 RepID=G7IU66_MEDTR|nr:transmembrane protein, putative [Medicago truncatula]